jgi:hypothetical protein
MAVMSSALRLASDTAFLILRALIRHVFQRVPLTVQRSLSAVIRRNSLSSSLRHRRVGIPFGFAQGRLSTASLRKIEARS